MLSLLSVNVFAISNRDITINVASPINDLQNESGMVAVENFPENITIGVMAKPVKLPMFNWNIAIKAEALNQIYTKH